MVDYLRPTRTGSVYTLTDTRERGPICRYGHKSIVLSLESAGVLLLVCVAMSVLTIGCCAALIFAKTRLVPHGDCARRIQSVELDLGTLAETVKHHSKTRAGRTRRTKEEKEEEEAEVAEPTVLSGMEKIRADLANSRGRLGG